MKRIVFLIVCVAAFYGCTQKRPAVIERPVFEVWSSTTLEIDKIEMTESATIFHFDAYFRPNNWIRIDKETYIRESGKEDKLLVTHSEGINLGEETYMPESGTISFKLFFPPLKPGIKKIDFIESDCSNCFKIWGIHLLPNSKIKINPVPKDIRAKAEPLPVPAFSTQPAKVSGQFFGYAKGMEPSKITVYVTNSITEDNNEVVFPVSDDGSFSGEITPGLPGLYRSSLGSLLLVPGQELKIYSDLNIRSRLQSRYRTDKEPGDLRHMYFSGYFTEAELDSISEATTDLFDYQELMRETVSMKPEEFKQHVLSIMNKRITDEKQNNSSAKAQLMAENSIKLTTFTLLMQYEAFINAAYMQVNQIKAEDRSKVTFKAEKPNDAYYSFLKGQITDNMAYLSNFRTLTTLLTSLYSLPDGKNKPAKEHFAYFKEKVSPIIGTEKSILFDIVQVKFFSAPLAEMKFFSDADKLEIKNVFKDNPAAADLLLAENDRLIALLAANKDNKESILNELPQTSIEKMFDAIIAKYKGKVVLVDFWATWCGPCMVAMKSILPMKDEMKGKDVVFLYLTGETSPLGAFTQTYPTITGEHYRVSGEQWSYWMKTFDIPGIPTYMVYDRQGKQLSRHLGFPGVETIKNSITKGL